jgi:DNA-binding IclR family transcriptional regulator
MTPHSLTDPAVLLDDLVQVRQRGHALSRNEHSFGVTSIAVAIPASPRTTQAALGLQMPGSRWSTDSETTLCDALRQAAERLQTLEELTRLPAH